MRIVILGIVFFLTFFQLNAQIKLTDIIGQGSWQDSASWLGSPPGCGDTIIIQEGDTVIVNDHINLDETSMPPCSSATYVEIRGTLFFQTGKKIYLACGSAVYIAAGGYLSEGSGGGASNIIDVCQSTIWQASDGPLSGPQWVGSGLPIELNYIDVKVEDGEAMIQWSTLSEINNDYFTIEKSYDLKKIEKIGYVIGAGSSTEERKYQFVDPELQEGVTYYRLKQTDFDGSSESFDWLAVNSNSSSINDSFEVYLIGNNLVINSKDRSKRIYNYQILDLTGREIQRGQVRVNGGQQILTQIHTKTSVLLLKIETERGFESYKLFIE